MVFISEDDIIKRKLLIEGESGMDDKRFSSLLEDFLRWASSEEISDDSVVTTMLVKINQCEDAMEQALLIQMMNVEQTQMYTKLLIDIDKAIEETKAEISNHREELKEARVIRKNRQEYHHLAKTVQEHPDRVETEQKLESMRHQLANLARVDRQYDEKLSLRKKQFHLFLVALRDLQKLVDEDHSSISPEQPVSPKPMDTL